MPLRVSTARISSRDPDALNVTRKSGGAEGYPFAPSWALIGPLIEMRRGAVELRAGTWEQYVEDYTAEMRTSYTRNRAAWNALLARPRVVLVCYCADPERCHRRVLAGILAKLGAIDEGEIAVGPARQSALAL